MNMSQGNSLYSYLKQANKKCFLQNQRTEAEQVLSGELVQREWELCGESV
jgi:hypothetical protein